MKLLKLGAVLVAVATLQSATFGAISLIYEEGPNAGQAYNDFGGLLTFKVTDFDIGTLYAPGSSAGYEGLPAPFDAGGVAAGVAAMDALGASHPTAQALGPNPGLNGGLEDTWGIARITRIQDIFGNAVWTPAAKGHELSVLFYGEQDFHIEPIIDPISGLYTGNDRINGINFHLDMYNCPLGSFDASVGAGARLPGNIFPGINDAGQLLELAMVSLPGFINGPGSGGGLASEFESRFNFTSLAGDGETWLELTGGDSQWRFDGDLWGVPDAFAMNAANAAILGPLGYDLDADFSAAFDTTVFAPGGWLVTSDDPLKTRLFMPEPLTVLGLCLGLSSVGAYVRRRRLV